MGSCLVNVQINYWITIIFYALYNVFVLNGLWDKVAKTIRPNCFRSPIHSLVRGWFHLNFFQFMHLSSGPPHTIHSFLFRHSWILVDESTACPDVFANETWPIVNCTRSSVHNIFLYDFLESWKIMIKRGKINPDKVRLEWLYWDQSDFPSPSLVPCSKKKKNWDYSENR